MTLKSGQQLCFLLISAEQTMKFADIDILLYYLRFGIFLLNTNISMQQSALVENDFHLELSYVDILMQ